MERNATIGMTASPDMRKRTRRNRLVLAAALTAALLPHLVLISLFVQRWIYESGESTYETMNEPIDGFSLNVAELDRCFRTAYPEDCQDLDLTGASLNVYVQDGRIVSGTMRVEYYRYIDESREGGKIRTVIFYLDPASGCLQEVNRYCGAGRGDMTRTEPIHAQTADFPLIWYVENLSSLAATDDDRTLRLNCDSLFWGIKMFIFDESADPPRLYAERMTDWSADTGFAGRTYELLSDSEY